MNSKINQYIQDNGKMENDMEKVFNIGLMVPCMKDIGAIVINTNLNKIIK